MSIMTNTTTGQANDIMAPLIAQAEALVRKLKGVTTATADTSKGAWIRAERFTSAELDSRDLNRAIAAVGRISTPNVVGVTGYAFREPEGLVRHPVWHSAYAFIDGTWLVCGVINGHGHVGALSMVGVGDGDRLAEAVAATDVRLSPEAIGKAAELSDTGRLDATRLLTR